MTVEMNTVNFAPKSKQTSNPLSDAVKEIKTKQEVRKAIKEELRMMELTEKAKNNGLTTAEKQELIILKRQAVIDRITDGIKNMPHPVVMYEA